jgi:hypothetical protein
MGFTQTEASIVFSDLYRLLTQTTPHSRISLQLLTIGQPDSIPTIERPGLEDLRMTAVKDHRERMCRIGHGQGGWIAALGQLESLEFFQLMFLPCYALDSTTARIAISVTSPQPAILQVNPLR